MKSLSSVFAVAGLLTPVAGCSLLDLQPVGAARIADDSAVEQLAQIRSANGLTPLELDSSLQEAAAQQARYMAQSGKMSHTTGFSRSFPKRMKSNGVTVAAAENIAAGRFEAGKAIQMWMDSPPHRRNMLTPSYTRYGLASVEGADGRKFWAMVLAQ